MDWLPDFLCYIILVVLLAHNIASGAQAEYSDHQAKPGCNSTCGNLTIPYPFGVEEKCYLDEEFLITCNYSYDPPQPFLMNSTSVMVTNISILGDLTINQLIAQECYYPPAHVFGPMASPGSNKGDTWSSLDLVSKFTVSESRNKFTVVGCDSQGFIGGSRLNSSGLENDYSSGCMSVCDYKGSLDATSCTGSGCCQLEIPPGLVFTNVTASSFNNHVYVWDFSPCTFAFIVEDGGFNFNSSYLDPNYMPERMPVVLEWTVATETSSSTIVCKGNATSYQTNNKFGYRCKCKEGYQGNPYLPYLQGGCQAIYALALRATMGMGCEMERVANQFKRIKYHFSRSR
ncbi:hypothetical protein Tsubulata_017798 [Turnera subulata]|uniref:Wall-associated receptor kinase galacturonan-binding domain-containing protein n=1 Tax=Turnera subulata TaxID=218843 RepID=A0A9Q0FZ97_9ROSI|nr:hypothetical protein Tsubulata_017798 [Turnera subulata]